MLQILGLSDKFILEEIDYLQFEHILNQIEKSREKEVFNDLLQFEVQKTEFVKFLPNLSEISSFRVAQTKVVNENLKYPKNAFKNLSITISKYCYLIESQWNWAEKNEFQGQSKEVDYIKNLNSDPSYFPVLIYVSPVSLQIKEQMADTLIALILELILESENKHLRIEEIINDIAQEMVSLNPAIELFEFKKAVLSKIRFMLYQGILEFEKCI
jgi:hypothetical protein